MFGTVVRDILLKRGGRVEVYVGSSGKWRRSMAGSPGNLSAFESVIYASGHEMSESAVLAAVRLGAKGSVSVAYTDTTSYELGFAEMDDNDGFGNTEAFLMQVGAKECLVPMAESPELRRLKAVLERCNVTVTERKQGEFSDKDTGMVDLKRLLAHEKALKHFAPGALGPVGALIRYLDLMSDESNYGKFRLSPFTQAEYMKLDHAAARALDLFPVQGSPSASSKGASTLFGLLNRCQTAMGSRLLLQWVKQPLLDISRINRRQNLVELFVANENGLCQSVVEHLKRVPDLARILKKIERRKSGLQDVVSLYQAIARMPDVKASLEGYAGTHARQLQAEFCDPLARIIADCDNLLNMVEHTIDLSRIDNHEYLINPAFNEDLQELSADKDKILDQISEFAESAADDLGLDAKKVKLDKNDTFGYFLRIPRACDGNLKKAPKGQYETLETRKDGVRFTCRKLKNLSDQFTALATTYNQKQKHLVDQAMEIVATYVPTVGDLNELLARLDAVISMAVVSTERNYVRPSITPPAQGQRSNDAAADTTTTSPSSPPASGPQGLFLKGARHPCVEVQEGISFIPNDVTLDRNGRNLIVLTGPNMGGKSTYIRTAGLVVVMAQMGCFVPCTSASVAITDRILARIGAGDSQVRGVSTFMAEMLETAAILKSATCDSLLIVDELGRGTSTYDGFGLAWAISEHIARTLGAPCLFATHFHELTALADQCPRVANAHVTALVDKDRLTLLYAVKPGPCDQSFGIQVAQMARFPEDVILAAKRKARQLEAFTSHVEGGADPATADEDGDDEDAVVARTVKRAKLYHGQDKEEGEAFLEQVLAGLAQDGNKEGARQRIRASANGFIKACLGESD